MRFALLVLAAIDLFGQNAPLSPMAEFDLNANPKHRPSRYAQLFFAATPNGLTLVTIEENQVSLVSADLDGHILHSKSDLASVNAQIYEALPLPDGSVWLVASGPYNLRNSSAGGPYRTAQFNRGPSSPSFTQLDLYSPAGEHLSALRLLSPAGGWENPIAAAAHLLVLRGNVGLITSQQPELIHFGTVAGEQFKESALVSLAPPVLGAIPVLTSNGNLLLIDKTSGSVVTVDPKTKSGSAHQPADTHPVQAAAADSNALYLLSNSTVLKTDFVGNVLSTYRLSLGSGFRPASLGVTGYALYLVDRAGRTERLQVD
jgi:hypothetical protein